jgi:hypothetical protein
MLLAFQAKPPACDDTPSPLFMRLNGMDFNLQLSELMNVEFKLSRDWCILCLSCSTLGWDMRIFRSLAVGIALVFLASASESPQKFFLIKLEKEATHPYLKRMSDGQHHYLVSDRLPSGSAESIELKLPADGSLFFAELSDAAEATVYGEIARIDRFAVVSIPSGMYPHLPHADGKPIPIVRIGSKLIKPNLSDRGTPSLDVRDIGTKANIPVADLKRRVEQLAGSLPVEVNGKSQTIRDRGSNEGKALARAFLKSQLQSSGFTVQEANYSGGVNLVAERIGNDPSRFVMITGHLDSVYNAGADDDASGVVSAWSIAEYLATMNLKHSVRFVAFDQEEIGLVGSEALAEQMNSAGAFDGLLGVFNIEMTGYDSDNDGAMHIIDCRENTSARLTALVETAVSAGRFSLKKIDACTNRSDHASFWQYDQPAIVVSQNFFGSPADSNPCYHRSCDKPDKMNFEYMAKLTNAMADAIASVVVE